MYKWIGEKLNIKTHASVRSYKSAEHADTSLNICWIFPVFEEKKRACKTSSQPALRWDRSIPRMARCGSAQLGTSYLCIFILVLMFLCFYP